MKYLLRFWFDLKAFLVEVQNRLTRRLLFLGIHVNNELNLVRLGSYYGGWWIPERSLSSSLDKKVCISAGIGGDVTFDEAILKAGFQVIALDPLEVCVNFAKDRLTKYSRFTAMQAGLWTHSGVQRFFAPRKTDHDSWSATNSQSTSFESSKEFEVISLENLLDLHPDIHNSEFSMLKMDIEGAELQVISSLLQVEHKFDWIAVEFDHLALIPFLSFLKRLRVTMQSRSLIQCMESSGYILKFHESFNLFFAKNL